ncbi:MAG: NAD(+)/NADH kinase [Campylobacterales bacterium]
MQKPLRLKLKKVGIILRPSTPQLKEYFIRVKTAFEKYGSEVLLDSLSAGMIGLVGVPFEQMCKESSLLVSIGGDGTLISLARRSYRYNKPILGIHVGRLGFLTDIPAEEIESFIEKIYKKEFVIDQRMVIEARLERGKRIKKFYAFNDIVLSKNSFTTMIHLKAFVDTKLLNVYYGDGLIISTPTGSTAYNLSAGGPIVYPLTESFIITPICPHALTQRPLVLPAKFEIKLETEDDGVVIVVDGQEIENFAKTERLSITIAPRPIRMIHRKERDFFDVLREKLGFGGAR